MSIPPRPQKYKILYLSVGVLCGFLGGALDLYGQGGKTSMGINLEQQVKAAGLKLGPFRMKTALYLSDAGYNSNVYRTPDNPISDFSITLGPMFYVYLPVKKKIIISIYESPRYVYFAETKRERTWNNYFNGQLSFDLNRYFIVLGKGYTIAREIWSTEIDVRPQRKEDTSQGALQWQITKKTSLLFRFIQAKYNYEDVSYAELGINSRRLNRTENRTSFTGYYRVSFRTTFFLDFEYDYSKFQDPLNPRDSKSYRLNSGFEFSSLGVLGGRINLGYKYYNVLQAGIDDYRGFFGDTSISIQVLDPLKIRANYRRDVQFSAYFSSAYYLESSFGGGASLYLSRNIRLDYDYDWGRNNYPGSAVQPSSLERQDDYRAQSGGIYYRLKGSVGLGVMATWWERDSSVSWANAKQTTIEANLIYSF